MVGEEMEEGKQKKNEESKNKRRVFPRKKEKQEESGVAGQPQTDKPKFGIRSAGAQLGRMNPAKSVGVKLFLIFFTAIVAFVLILGLMSYNKARSTIQANAANSNKQTIIQTSEKLDIILKQYEDIALQIFFDPETQNLLTDLSA